MNEEFTLNQIQLFGFPQSEGPETDNVNKYINASKSSFKDVEGFEDKNAFMNLKEKQEDLFPIELPEPKEIKKQDNNKGNKEKKGGQGNKGNGAGKNSQQNKEKIKIKSDKSKMIINLSFSKRVDLETIEVIPTEERKDVCYTCKIFKEPIPDYSYAESKKPASSFTHKEKKKTVGKRSTLFEELTELHVNK